MNSFVLIILLLYSPFFLCVNSTLNSSITQKSNSFIPYTNNCSGSSVINTTDEGYLQVGIVSYITNNFFPTLWIIKFDKYSRVQFKTSMLQFDSEFLVHRIQETESYYYLILQSRNSTLLDYNINIIRLSKSGIILFSIPLNNGCTNNYNNFFSFLYIIKNDSQIISACCTNDADQVKYMINDINNMDLKIEFKINGQRWLTNCCFHYRLRNVAQNSEGQIIFGGDVSFQSPHLCLFTKLSWSDFLFTTIFNTQNDSYNSQIRTEGCYHGNNNERSDTYNFMSSFSISDSSFIAMNFNNFVIIYSVINGNGIWGGQSNHQCSFDISIYSNPSASDLSFIYPLFLMTGSLDINGFHVLFTAICNISSDPSSKDYINIFPETLPITCTAPALCHFKGNSIARTIRGNYVVVGNAKFAISSFQEWISLLYDEDVKLLFVTRKLNNANFIGKSTALLNDQSIIISGIDLISQPILKLSGGFTYINEERLIINDQLIINSIISSGTMSFFAGGYTVQFTSINKYPCILEIDDQFTIIKNIIFTAEQNTMISNIILSKSLLIYGAIRPTLEKGDSKIFLISTYLENKSLQTQTQGLTEVLLNGITEIEQGRLCAVGQTTPEGKIHISKYNPNLDVLISTPNLISSPTLQALIITLNSVTLSNNGNIVSVGSYEKTSINQDCIAIMFSSELSFMVYSVFGTDDKDNLYQVISTQDKNLLMVGFQSINGFIRMYSRTFILIKEQIFSDQKVVLNSIIETNFEKGIATGSQKISQNFSLIVIQYTIQIECDKGFTFDPDKVLCIEICGDNLDLGNYECDNDKLTCCNKKCNLEPDYSIVTDPITLLQKCKLTYQIISSSQLVEYDNQSFIILKLSREVTLFNDYKSGIRTAEQMKKCVLINVRNNSRLNISLIVKEVLPISTTEIKIFYNDINNYMPYSKELNIDISNLNVVDKEGVIPNPLFHTFKLATITILKKNPNAIFELSNSLVATTSIILGGASIVNVLLSSQGMNAIFNLLGPLQIIILNALIGLQNYPTSIVATFNSMSFVSMSFLPSFIQNLIPSKTVSTIVNAKNIVGNAKYHPSIKSTNIFINLQTKFLILIGINIGYLIVLKLKQKISILKEVEKILVWNTFLRVSQTLFFEYTICSFMQLCQNDPTLRWVNDFGNCVSITLFLAILLFLFKIESILQFTTIEELKNGQTKKLYGALYEGFKANEVAKYNIIAFYLRRFLSLLVLFILYNYPIIQSLMFGLVSLLYLIWILKSKPDQSLIIQTSNILTESIIIMIHIEVTVLAVAEITGSYYYDNLVSFIVITIQLATIIQFFFSILMPLKEAIYKFFFQKKKEENKDENKKDTKVKKVVFTFDRNHKPITLHCKSENI